MIFVMVFLLLLASMADAFTPDLQCVEINAANYNQKVDGAPYLLTAFLGSEKINLNIFRNNGTLFQAGLEMVDGRIERVIEGSFNDSTIVFNSSQSAMNEVIASSDRISAFKNLTDQGRIDIHAEGWLAQAKLKAVLSSASVLQFGYDLFFG